MLKNLFRLFAGGPAHPEIVFTCRGIYSELVIRARLRQLPAGILRPLCLLPGATIKPAGWRSWCITVMGPTGALANIHNVLLHSRGIYGKR
jgi:hypothetical protein